MRQTSSQVIKIIMFFALAALVSGCASITELTEADAATWGDRFDDDFACLRTTKSALEEDYFTYGKNKEILKHNRELWIKEVKRRGLITPEEWELISSNQIAMNMGKCAMYLSWGKPDRENKSVYGNTVKIQHVYGRRSYVYTTNGVITSWHTPN